MNINKTPRGATLRQRDGVVPVQQTRVPFARHKLEPKQEMGNRPVVVRQAAAGKSHLIPSGCSTRHRLSPIFVFFFVGFAFSRSVVYFEDQTKACWRQNVDKCLRLGVLELSGTIYEVTGKHDPFQTTRNRIKVQTSYKVLL